MLSVITLCVVPTCDVSSVVRKNYGGGSTRDQAGGSGVGARGRGERERGGGSYIQVSASPDHPCRKPHTKILTSNTDQLSIRTL